MEKHPHVKTVAVGNGPLQAALLRQFFEFVRPQAAQQGAEKAITRLIEEFDDDGLLLSEVDVAAALHRAIGHRFVLSIGTQAWELVTERPNGARLALNFVERGAHATWKIFVSSQTHAFAQEYVDRWLQVEDPKNALHQKDVANA